MPTVSDAYSNAVTLMQNRELTRDDLSKPGNILSDVDLVSISMGEGEFIGRYITNEAQQNIPIILKRNEQAIFRIQNALLSENGRIDKGDFILTNNRYVFLGKRKSIDQGLSKITTIKLLDDGIGIVRSNKQKIKYYKGNYYWPLVRSVVMGVINKYIYMNHIVATPDADTEVLAGLTSLGYSVVEARAAIQSIPKDAPKDVEERLRIALQYFASNVLQ